MGQVWITWQNKGWGRGGDPLPGPPSLPFPFLQGTAMVTDVLSPTRTSLVCDQTALGNRVSSTPALVRRKRERPPPHWRKINDRDSKSERLSGNEVEGGPCH